MTQMNRSEIRESIHKWWQSYIGNREYNSAARALAARLRRATGVEALLNRRCTGLRKVLVWESRTEM